MLLSPFGMLGAFSSLLLLFIILFILACAGTELRAALMLCLVLKLWAGTDDRPLVGLP